MMAVSAAAHGANLTCRYRVADGLRPDEACPPWTYSIMGDTLCLPNRMVLSSSAGKQTVAYFQNQLVLPDTLVIRFRMRLISGNSTASAAGPADVYFDRNSMVCYLNIAQDRIFFRGPGHSRGATAEVPTTDRMHTYCIQSWGDTVRVSQDSLPVLEGLLVPDLGMALKSKNSIGWGENHPAAFGTSEWEFVEHNALACEDTLPRKSQPPVSRPFWDSKVDIQARLDARGFALWPMPEASPDRLFRDEFDGHLQPGWTWLRMDPATWQVTSTKLAIAPQRGGLHQDTNDARNLLLRDVKGTDLVVTLGIEAYLAWEINGAYLLLYQDDDTHVAIGLTRTFNENLGMYDLCEWEQKLIHSLVIQSDTGRVLVRAILRGRRLQLQYSYDGSLWRVQDEFEIAFTPTRIGIMSIDGHEPRSSSFAFFDFIEICEYERESPAAARGFKP